MDKSSSWKPYACDILHYLQDRTLPLQALKQFHKKLKTIIQKFWKIYFVTMKASV